MNRLAIVFFFFLVAIGCSLGDQTQFWQRKRAVFTAQDVPIYQVEIAHIGLYWHQGSGSAVLIDPSVDRPKVIWKVSPIKPVQFAGFAFELFKTPSGFRVDIDSKGDLPQTGVYSVEVQGVANNRKRLLLYYEFSPKLLSQIKRR
jgi:hypothetical protein